MLRVLRVLQIQANRLWTWLEGEAEESEEEEEETQDPQETGETRDDPQSIKTEGSGAVGMEVEQVAVLRVLHACFFVASRGWYAPCCAWCAFSAFYMSCLRRASGGQTSRRSRSAEASPRDGRSGGQRRTQGARRRRCRRRCRTHGGLSRGR